MTAPTTCTHPEVCRDCAAKREHTLCPTCATTLVHYDVESWRCVACHRTLHTEDLKRREVS